MKKPQRPLTIEDIRNPKRKSGFDHVKLDHRRINQRHPYNAQTNGQTGPGLGQGWAGPTRATAEEAAQDYCDYVNQGHAQRPLKLKTAGHSGVRPSIPRDPEVEAALGVLRDARAQRQGKEGYIYVIREVKEGGGFSQVKVGYSTNPWKRVAELQTGNPRPLALVCMKKGTPDDEKALHQKYISANILQEWFHVSKELLLEFDLDADGNPYPAAQSGGDDPKEGTTK